MIQFNTPFLPEFGYTRFLERLGSRLHSVHFSLYDQAVQDARIKMKTTPTASLAELLTMLESPKKYLLANGRFHAADVYTDKESMSRLTSSLELLLNNDVLDGIVFSDSYFLMALGKAASGLAGCLEAVPSVNFMITDLQQVDVLMETVAIAGFKVPEKVTLDRSLNRSPARLSDCAASIKKHYPIKSVEVLANEGCLNHCPFRATHEAIIASVNIDNSPPSYDTRQLNRTLACIHLLLDDPHRILSSPFIRPEDVSLLPEHVDVVKLCGRTLGSEFLTRCIEAFVSERYAGNLFELLDAAHWMKEHWLLDNSTMPVDFYTRMCACGQVCSQCDFCERLFSSSAVPLAFKLQDMRSSV